MKRLLVITALCILRTGAPETATAQQLAPRKPEFWVAGSLAMAVALPLDVRIRDFAARHHSERLDRFATEVGRGGSPQFILPALLAGSVIPRLLGDPATSNAVMDIGLAYVTTSVAGVLARRIIGRHRPDDRGGSARFAPFRREHEWHSFPSGHVLGVMSLATGISIKANRPWVTTLSFGLASLVGVQRLYAQQHWASDVVGATMLGIATSASMIRWRERHRSGSD